MDPGYPYILLTANNKEAGLQANRVSSVSRALHRVKDVPAPCYTKAASILSRYRNMSEYNNRPPVGKPGPLLRGKSESSRGSHLASLPILLAPTPIPHPFFPFHLIYATMSQPTRTTTMYREMEGYLCDPTTNLGFVDNDAARVLGDPIIGLGSGHDMVPWALGSPANVPNAASLAMSNHGSLNFSVSNPPLIGGSSGYFFLGGGPPSNIDIRVICEARATLNSLKLGSPTQGPHSALPHCQPTRTLFWQRNRLARSTPSVVPGFLLRSRQISLPSLAWGLASQLIPARSLPRRARARARRDREPVAT